LIDSQAGTEDPAAAPIYEQMHQTWLDHGPGPVQDAVASIILGPGQWDDWFAKWAAIDNDQNARGFRCLMDRDDITSRLSEISCPALIVHGTADAAIPVAKAEALRDGLAGQVTLTLVDGAPHASNLTHPEPVNKAIAQFLRTLSD
jgi:pimeloyl-ACP methyl ester carboxylesterase